MTSKNALLLLFLICVNELSLVEVKVLKSEVRDL
jgi:hypothetical protein